MKKNHLKYIYITILLLSIVLIPIMPFCSTTASTSTTDPSDNNSITPKKTSSITYSPDGKGYLKEIGPQKFLLHVEGSSYEMGYQHGFLCAENVSKMTSDEYFVNFMAEFVGVEGDGLLEAFIGVELFIALFGSIIDPEIIEEIFYAVDNELTEFLLAFFIYLCQLNLKYVPNEFIEEMQGVADGATDAGYETRFENVLLLNMAFDLVLSFYYPIMTPISFFSDLFHACNAYVAHGSATVDGRTIMGRDYMFLSDAYHDVLLLEQVPDNGNAFVSTQAPGFVGVTAAMNSKGIGIGIDMCYAMDCTPADFGMGSALTARYVTQYANELSEAVSIIKNSKRGVSWIYTIGDGRGSEIGGCVLEVSANHCFPRYSNYQKPWWMPQINQQIENKDDVLVTTNHFIRTEMNILALASTFEDSLWRYEVLTNLILDNYGDIDVEKGKELIDFLHPPNYGYYGNDTHQKVRVAISSFDLTNLEVNALFGHYDDPWANYHLEAP